MEGEGGRGFGNRGGGRSGGSGGGFSSGPRTMHKATCTDCGSECEVPFQPTAGKPVRCQDCFRKSRPRY